MLSTFEKIRALVNPKDRKKVLFLTALMVLTALMQTVGVASIMPFLSVLSDPEIIDKNQLLNTAYIHLNFSSAQSFLYFLGLTAFTLFVAGTILQAVTFWAIVKFSNMQQYELSRRLMHEYLQRPYTFFLTRNSSDLAKTVLHETSQAINGALMPAMRLLSQIILAAFVIALLIAINPFLSILIALLVGGIYGIIYILARTWLINIGKDRVNANKERYTATAEAFTGAKEIRLLGREADYLERYRKPSKRLAKHEANSTLIADIPQYGIEAFAFGGILVLVIFMASGERGIADALPVIGVYALAGRQIIPAFQKIFTTFSALRYNIPAVDNVLKDLNSELSEKFHQHSDSEKIHPKRSIKLENITFTYPEGKSPAIKNTSIEINAKTTVGFIGPSGSGKSTIVDVLLGLLTPEKGSVFIDDTRLSAENIRQWQRSIGYVPQHIFLADQSIAANIALGVPEEEIDHAAVERAAKLANLHGFVANELPEGYKTIVGERGVRLSGGQRQRIGIARALYRDPEVLFFDEATSALDNATEHAVMEAIHNLTGSKTIILVAHRLSTVKSCDEIFSIKKGNVEEKGNWEQLHLEKNI
ncbi:ABC transporter ATP-binding protein [Ectothiorhodospira shaposhnikovii]|uniref:ABC transporter ATP-binding protein n=1 Tax=Ectothiorhodospira shaposhnikovii TaxID=1054 RepID=UPI0039A050CE